jgi:hypothetical protein
MWTSNGWFGLDRMHLSSLREGALLEATDEKSARQAAMSFSSKPENMSNSYHVNKVGDKHYVSLYPSKNDVAVYKGGKCVSEAVHTVDWDGSSDVAVTRRTPDEIEVRRIDASGKPMSGDEHSMIYTRNDPEFEQIASKEDAVDDHEAWREKRAARLQGRMYHESVDMNESRLWQPQQYGSYTLKTGQKTSMREGPPSHVVAHTRKMGRIGVPVHDKDDYGDTVAIRVENTKTGKSTLHHVYQRGMSSRADEQSKRLVSVRSVGRPTEDSEKHNEVIKNYLAGKRAKE